MAENTLASLTERIKQVDRGATVIDQDTTVVLSNTLTGIQNAFNKILTYSKNMNKIQEAKLEDADLYNKEAQLEAPRPAPIVATSETQSESNLAILIPSLLKVIKKLDKELQYLDLSGQECACDTQDGFDDDDFDRKKKKRRKPNSRRTRTRAPRARRMPRIPRLPAGAGVAAAGATFAVAATGSILYGIDSFMKSTNVDTRKKQDQGISKFGISGNNTEGYVINGKNVGGYQNLPEYYKNVVDGYGANNRGGSAERARQYVQSHNPDGSAKQAPRKAKEEAPEIVVTAPAKKEAGAKQDEKLIKAATKAATAKVQAVPVRKPEPTKGMSKQGHEWTGKVSMFIGDTYRNVTSFMGGFLAKLASLGSQLGGFLSGGAESLAGLFGFGGGAGFQEANVAGVKGEWAKDTGFINGVNQLSQKWNIDAGDLLGLFHSESGVNAQARNPSGATGIIQFMPDTARALGTSTDAIYKMNKTQQLTLVDQYFAMSKLPKGATAGQLYATVFLPAYNRKSENFVIARPNGPNDAGKTNPKWYTQNAGLDVNRDGVITIADLGLRLSKKRQEIGLGASKAGSGFRALANLGSGALSGLAGLAGDAATFVGDVGAYISNSIHGTASKFLGLNENQGAPALNQFVGKYFQQGFNVKRTPWCAAFANSVLGSQGIKGTGSAAAISFRNFGGLVWDRQAGGNLQAAAKGDIAVFKRPQGTGHVAFVDSINIKAGTITYVGGNQSDRSSGGQVSKSTIRIDNPTNGLIAIRRASGGSPAGQPPVPPAGKSGFQNLAQVVAIEKAKKTAKVRSTSTSRGTPGRVVPVPGPGNRPPQKQKKSAMDQFLGYFGAA